MGCNDYVLPEELCSEMCRFGAAELHVVAAFIGGIASQEVIKVRFISLSLKMAIAVSNVLYKRLPLMVSQCLQLITKQFVPMLGTFIFNGIDHKSHSLTL